MEKTVFYALYQEISQKTVISGGALEALKSFLMVLEDFLPGSAEMMTFIRALNRWVNDSGKTVINNR